MKENSTVDFVANLFCVKAIIIMWLLKSAWPFVKQNVIKIPKLSPGVGPYYQLNLIISRWQALYNYSRTQALYWLDSLGTSLLRNEKGRNHPCKCLVVRRPVAYLKRKVKFCAAHRLCSPHLSEEDNIAVYGKCFNPNGHGHNYVGTRLKEKAFRSCWFSNRDLVSPRVCVCVYVSGGYAKRRGWCDSFSVKLVCPTNFLSGGVDRTRSQEWSSTSP